MNKLEKYSAYKDSGVEWLGEIPEHWNIVRLGTLGNFTASGIDKYIINSESLVKIINFTDIYSRTNLTLDSKINYMEVTTPELNRKKHLVKKGDLIFLPSSETFEDLGLSALVNEELDNTSFSYHVIRLEFKKDIEHNFRKYLSNNNFVLNQFSSYGKGTTRKIIGRNIFKNVRVLIPPKQEQIKIAKFLDTKTQQLDIAIKQKEQLIELLKERRQIIINDAVTKGIDKTVAMKDSGVEWIGEIPEGWEVKKNKYIFFEVDERSKDGKEELLSVSHMTGVTPRSEKNVNMFMAEDYTGSKTCSKDDLVINIMWAWMGAMGISDRIGIVSSSYGIYRQITKDTLNTRYLEYLLKTNKYIEEYNKRSTGLHASRLRLYSDMFFDMKIGFPNYKEQQKIVNYIEENNNKIDKAIDLQQQQIIKLKEYKSTLIEAIVTGKVRI